MIEVGDTIISRDVFEEHFICDLCKCKGQCCVEGDSGAPITKEEKEQIEAILPVILDDLSPSARKVIAEQGISYLDYDSEIVTSLVEGRECVFTYYDEHGICKCAIDTAYREGRIDVQKPISCHLYPIRVAKYKDFTALNYHRWSICQPAVKKGNKEGVPLYIFLKEPLIRMFGENWYEEVCQVANVYKNR